MDTNNTNCAWPIVIGGTAMNKAQLTNFQQEQVAVYQAELAAVDGKRHQVGEVGQRALGLLVESLRRLLRQRVLGMLEARYGRSWALDLIEDFVGDAEVALIDAAGTYDVSKGALFRTWIFGNGGPVTGAVRDAIDTHDGVTHLTQGERVVLRYVTSVLSEIQDVDGSYCTQTLQERVEAAVYDYARSVGAKALERAGVSAQSPNFNHLLEKRVQERLRKDGVLRALRNVPLLLQDTSRGVVTLDTDTEGTGWRESLAAASTVEDDVMSAHGPAVREEQLLQMATLGMSVQDRDTVWQILSGDGAVGDVNMVDVQARLGSPLAHFAVLSPTVGMQVVTTD